MFLKSKCITSKKKLKTPQKIDRWVLSEISLKLSDKNQVRKKND